MEDIHAILRVEYGPLAWLITSRLARAYRCDSIADYCAHRSQIQPTTLSRLSDERCTFARGGVYTLQKSNTF
ncbi:hypothetical protein EXS73_00830 [Candidatus Pacearchaeota archaeon]|nr:hypothetical protein [Candidatus Pacearchaeota archaeon]